MTRTQLAALDADLRARPMRGETLAERRAGFAEIMAREPAPAGFRSAETELGGVRTLAIEPEADARPGTILYFHGGAWMLGSPETHRGFTAELVVRTGVRALSVDYRLAPENPYPAGVDDALTAYRALLDTGEDPTTIVLAGDSAGGGMAVATLLGARDAGLPLPAGAVLFSPGLDQTRTGASTLTRGAHDPILSRQTLMVSGRLYLGDLDPLQPRLSPAVVGELAGLPPLLIQVGTNEILLDDSVRFATRAREAEVDVILDVVAGAPHVFPMFASRIREGADALDRAALFVQQRLG
jgi:epsilon-lactone hydrolase